MISIDIIKLVGYCLYMFQIFKKRKTVEPVKELPKRTLKLVDDKEEDFDVRQTTIELTFEDGHVMLTQVRGLVQNYCTSGHDAVKSYSGDITEVVEPKSEVKIIRSDEIPLSMLTNLGDFYGNTYIFEDMHACIYLNSKSSTVLRRGTLKSIKLVKTETFYQKLLIKKVVPV